MIEKPEDKLSFMESLWIKYKSDVKTEIIDVCKGFIRVNQEFCIFVYKRNEYGTIYLIPFDEYCKASLRDEVFSFWGPAYISGHDIRAELMGQTEENPDYYILSRTGISYYKFSSDHENSFSYLIAKLNMFIRLKAISTVISHYRVFSLEELISRFNDALRLNDFETATRLIENIRERPDISVVNKVFLSIKLYYFTGNWERIVTHPLLLSVKDMRRPKVITEYILMAYFNRYIRPVQADLNLAREKFRTFIAPVISSMITFDENYEHEEIYLLLALAVSEKPESSISELQCVREKLEQVKGADYPLEEYLELIKMPDIPNVIDLQRLQTLADYENFDDIIVILQANFQALTIDSIRFALKFPPNELTYSRAKNVFEIIENLNDELKNQIHSIPALSRAIEKIKSIAIPNEISIDGWLNLIISGGDSQEISSKFVQLNTTLDEQKITYNTIQQLETLFKRGADNWADSIKQLIAYIVKKLEDNENIAVTLEWKLNLLGFIVSMERIGASDISLINRLVAMIIKEPLSKPDSEQLITGLMIFWEKIAAPNNLLWPVEIIDEILDNQPAEIIPINEFIIDYISFLYSQRNSLDGSNLSIIKGFFETKQEYLTQIKSLIEDNTLSDKRSNSEDYIRKILNDVSIGIYTLIEPAANRAKRYFESINNNANIGVNHDKECTDNLKSLYRSSKIFVFAAKAAAHQAFYCIERDKIIYPSGKGASSIIKVISDKLFSYGN